MTADLLNGPEGDDQVIARHMLEAMLAELDPGSPHRGRMLAALHRKVTLGAEYHAIPAGARIRRPVLDQADRVRFAARVLLPGGNVIEMRADGNGKVRWKPGWRFCDESGNAL